MIFDLSAQLIASVVLALIIIQALLVMGPAYGIYLERKIASWAQNRIGPNRTGPLGLLQPMADGLKFLMKEDYTPGNADKVLFTVAPMLAVIPALMGWAVIPWGGQWHSPWGLLDITVLEINVGVIYILALGSLGVYGISVGAWSANNKYTFLGGIRATAQMLSYEIPMGLCVLCVLLMAGTASASGIVEQQVDYWWGFIPAWHIVQQPLAAILFFICVLAEANRTPFDLAEAEQELIGGYHTEYSSLRFAMFFLGEYVHMGIGSAFFAVLFLGGWHLPWFDLLLYGTPMPVDGLATGGIMGQLLEAGVAPWIISLLGVILKIHVLLGKSLLMMLVMMWIRWTLPRFRFDQLMKLAWRSIIPITLGLLLITGVWVYMDWAHYLWAGNLLLIVIVLIVSPLLPGDQVNRRLPLRGSRFSPVQE
jgi:NADH-quinone oxidoreductase subunit H